MADAPLVWLTRPEGDNRLLADQLEASGIRSILSSVIIIKYINNNKLNENLNVKHQAILLTSRHAVHALAALSETMRECPVFCVGEATAEAAKKAGFGQVIAGQGNLLDLVPELIAQLPAPTHVLYLAGEHTRVDIAALLAPRGIHIDTQIVYEAEPVATLSTELVQALENSALRGVAFYSPRSAQLAYEALTTHQLAQYCAGIDAYCLSLAVAQAAATAGWRSIQACHQPTGEAMRNLIVSRLTHPVI